MERKELVEMAIAYGSREFYLDIVCKKWEGCDEDRYNGYIDGFMAAIRYFDIKEGKNTLV